MSLIDKELPKIKSLSSQPMIRSYHEIITEIAELQRCLKDTEVFDVSLLGLFKKLNKLMKVISQWPTSITRSLALF